MRMREQDGFIAITSAVVIAVLLMTVTLSLNLAGFFARFNILNVEYKERSFSLAEACVDAALLRLAVDREYLGDETISFGTLACAILPVIHAGQITIRTRAYFPQSGVEKTATNLVVVVASSSLDVLSWKEVPLHT